MRAVKEASALGIAFNYHYQLSPEGKLLLGLDRERKSLPLPSYVCRLSRGKIYQVDY